MEVLTFITVIGLAGLVAGVLSGLLGVGGGIILVPAFYYVFQKLGYTPEQLMQICVATSTGTIIITSLRALKGHYKRGAVSVELMRSWGPLIGVGAVIGVLAAASLRSAELQVIFGGIGVTLGLYMLLGKRSWRLSDTLPGRGLSALYSMMIGFFSALMGIGGGSFTVPILTAYNMPAHRAVGTSSGFGLLISAPAFLTFLLTGWHVAGKPPGTLGFVNLPSMGVIAISSAVAVPLGVKLSHRLSPAHLRLVFALTTLLLSGHMLLKAVMG